MSPYNDPRAYRMKNLGVAGLVGRKVLAAWISQEKDRVALDTDTGRLWLCWNGDCCARCYLAHMSGAEYLVGATIVEAFNAEWVEHPKKDEYDDVTESMGTNIRTDKGHVTFESRVEHNGYYGGSIDVSADDPMDQYSSPEKAPEGLSPLVDF